MGDKWVINHPFGSSYLLKSLGPILDYKYEYTFQDRLILRPVLSHVPETKIGDTTTENQGNLGCSKMKKRNRRFF